MPGSLPVSVRRRGSALRTRVACDGDMQLWYLPFRQVGDPASSHEPRCEIRSMTSATAVVDASGPGVAVRGLQQPPEGRPSTRWSPAGSWALGRAARHARGVRRHSGDWPVRLGVVPAGVAEVPGARFPPRMEVAAPLAGAYFCSRSRLARSGRLLSVCGPCHVDRALSSLLRPAQAMPSRVVAETRRSRPVASGSTHRTTSPRSLSCVTGLSVTAGPPARP